MPMKKHKQLQEVTGLRKKTAELNQPVYFKDVLTSVWKPGHVLHWGRGFALVCTGEEKLWIPSKLIKIRVEKEKPLDKDK